MNIIRKIREYFFQTTTDGSRFRTNDEPREATFRDLFNSIPFIAERIDRAKVYGSTQYPQGLVVKNTDADVKSRTNPIDVDAAGNPFSYTVDAENLPDVKMNLTIPVDPNIDIDVAVASEDNYSQYVANKPVTVEDNTTDQTKRTVWKIALHTNFIDFLLSYLNKLSKFALRLILPKSLPNSMPSVNSIGQIHYDAFRSTPHVKTSINSNGDTEIQLSEQLIQMIANRIVAIPEPTKMSAVNQYGFVDNAEMTTHDMVNSLRYNTSCLGCVNTQPFVLKNTKHVGIGYELGATQPVQNDKIIVSSVHGDYTDVGRGSHVNELGSNSTYNHIGIGKDSNNFPPQLTIPVDVSTKCAFVNNIKNNVCVSNNTNCSNPNPEYMPNRLSIGENYITHVPGQISPTDGYYLLLRLTDFQGNMSHYRTKLELVGENFKP